MTDTLRLWEADAYTREFTAVVLVCEEKAGVFRIALDQSAFFPEGGGQSGDTGWLHPASGDPVWVFDTHEKDGITWHYTDKELPPGSQVRGVIDWDRRFDLMQNHSGEHIVSGLIHRHFGFDNVGFHMGSDFITIDINGILTMDDLAVIEEEANRVVWADERTQVRVYTHEEASRIAYRSKKDFTGDVRLVVFPGADVCACCGTHVSSAGQIGLIRLLSAEKFRSGVRIELLCGRRALQYCSEIGKQNQKVSVLLSAPPLETAQAVSRLKKQMEEASYQLYSMKLDRLDLIAGDIVSGRDEVRFEKNLDAELLRKLALKMMERTDGICAAFSGDDESGYMFVIGQTNGDVTLLVKAISSRLGGRGGGKPHFAQGRIAGKRQEILSLLKEFMEI